MTEPLKPENSIVCDKCKADLPGGRGLWVKRTRAFVNPYVVMPVQGRMKRAGFCQPCAHGEAEFQNAKLSEIRRQQSQYGNKAMLG